MLMTWTAESFLLLFFTSCSAVIHSFLSLWCGVLHSHPRVRLSFVSFRVVQ